MKKIICKKDLMELGYSEYAASKIIRESKKLLVAEGYNYYSNRRVGRVPGNIVERVIGISLAA